VKACVLREQTDPLCDTSRLDWVFKFLASKGGRRPWRKDWSRMKRNNISASIDFGFSFQNHSSK
jgi:hypothetical protein